jgi:hypothetical protein
MKMKKIYLIASIFIFGCSDKKNADLNDYELNGKVKLLVENSFEAEEKFGEIIKGKNLYSYESRNHTIIFNKLGKISQEKNTISAHKIEYIYDDNNNLELKNSYDINKKLICQEIFKYDINGNCIEISNYKNLKINRLEKIKYDNFNNPIEENAYDISGKLTYKCKKEFKDNNLIKKMTYLEDGNLYSVLKYKYDKNGNETESIWYNSLGEIEEKINNKYDSNNLLIEKTSLNSWSEGQMYKWQFTYKFDKNKNWVQKIVIRDNNPILMSLEERRIEYY